jgi:hypothetical protein
MGFVSFPISAEIISLKSINKFIFVMVKCGVFFAVRTEILVRRASASEGRSDGFTWNRPQVQKA